MILTELFDKKKINVLGLSNSEIAEFMWNTGIFSPSLWHINTKDNNAPIRNIWSLSSTVANSYFRGHHSQWSNIQKELISKELIKMETNYSNDYDRGHYRLYSFTDAFFMLFNTIVKKKKYLDIILKDFHIHHEVANVDMFGVGRKKDHIYTDADKKAIEFMDRLQVIDDGTIVKEILSMDKNDSSLIELISFSLSNKDSLDYGKGYRLYTSFSSISKGGKTCMTLNGKEYKKIGVRPWLCIEYKGRPCKLSHLDLVATYPTLTALLLRMLLPDDKSIDKFYKKVMDPNNDIYNYLKKCMTDTKTELYEYSIHMGKKRVRRDRKHLKTAVQKLLFNNGRKTELDDILLKKFPTVSEFLTLFRFKENDKDKAANAIEPLSEGKFYKFKELFPESLEQIKRIASGDTVISPSGKEMKGSSIYFHVMEQMEAKIFKTIFEEDNSGYLMILHDALYFPEGRENFVVEQMRERLRILGIEQLNFHLGNEDKEETITIKSEKIALDNIVA
jgi:hypothetical protein